MPRPETAAIADALGVLESLVALNGAEREDVALDVVRQAVKPVELMGVSEAAAELGVTTSNLGRLAKLPEPLAELRGGKVYDADAIRALAAERAATTTTEG